MMSKKVVACFLVGGRLTVLTASTTAAPSDTSAAGQPNPPIWPPSVKVYGPGEDATAQTDIYNAYAVNGRGDGTQDNDHGQFSDQRFAFLFKPGTYSVDAPVGFYTQVLGLGTDPSQVSFTHPKGVYCQEGAFQVTIGALDTFWRGAENFESHATWEWFDGHSGMLWAASQAAPLRRIKMNGDLTMFMYRPPNQAADFASGGYAANSMVTGKAHPGSQQQYFHRNMDYGGYGTSVWNTVFSGCNGAPPSHCGDGDGQRPFVNVGANPLRVEKPFITIDPTGKYNLNVPQANTNPTMGHDWSVGTPYDFSQVYVAKPSDTAAVINAQLAAGLHVVLAPGIYNLESALQLQKPNQVLLGLGLATLIANNPDGAVIVADVEGVRVGGVILQAGDQKFNTRTLLRWGNQGSTYAGNPANPGFMHDVFGRVGGPTISGTGVSIMVEINSGNVGGDDLWLWRADHGQMGPVVSGQSPCDHALVVNGNDVTMQGLAVEHVLKDMVVWNGNGGKTYFFQAEYPYDVDQSYGNQYVAYRVADNVQTHECHGCGVYHYFRDNPVTVATGFRCPPALEASFKSPLGVYLNGKGTMTHIINDKGDTTARLGDGPTIKYWCVNGLEANSSTIVV